MDRPQQADGAGRPERARIAAPPYPPVTHRSLKIFAVDPMEGRSAGNRTTIQVEYEPLKPGPRGERIEVIDYDGTHDRHYPPVNLDDSSLMLQDGLEPLDFDPRFHQQMVYAVAMRTLENFDRALGRRLKLNQGVWVDGKQQSQTLRLYPHAFYGRNAFYDADRHAVFFGYFSADAESPGRNIPSQTVFTCLSHDIIVHEVTHAIVHKLRPFFMEHSNEDVPAFHEAFADLVALFQHFSYRDLLREKMQANRGDLRKRDTLIELAGQFGHAAGLGNSLRSAIEKDGRPDPSRMKEAIEPHERGSILVSAIFDGFFDTYERRTRDLIRIATGGTGNLPDGDLHPDLVARIAGEAARLAQQQLNMCIRAIDYLPPVQITFGDYLRAVITADDELSPDDEWGQRAALIEAFRRRGIFPKDVASLAEESMLWEPAPPDFPPVELGGADTEMLDLFLSAAMDVSIDRARHGDGGYAKPSGQVEDIKKKLAKSPKEIEFFIRLRQYGEAHRKELKLHPTLPVRLMGAHPAFRLSPTGQMLVEFVFQFAQQLPPPDDDFGGLKVRGGTTVIASWDGRIRFVIAKPLPHDDLDEAARKVAEARVARQKAYAIHRDAADAAVAYMTPEERRSRMADRSNFQALHGGG